MFPRLNDASNDPNLFTTQHTQRTNNYGGGKKKKQLRSTKEPEQQQILAPLVGETLF